MIDDVIRRAKTEIQRKKNQIVATKQDQRLIVDRLDTFRLELQGWEAYLKVLQKEAGK